MRKKRLNMALFFLNRQKIIIFLKIVTFKDEIESNPNTYLLHV